MILNNTFDGYIVKDILNYSKIISIKKIIMLLFYNFTKK